MKKTINIPINVIKNTMVKRLVAIVVLICLFFYSPFFQVLKSYAVMAVYSQIHENQSFLKEKGIEIRIPGGLATLKKDYYPFVMTYDTSEEFSEYVDEKINLVVLYNFGAMNWLRGSSSIYDMKSPYYSGFYGAYVASYQDDQRNYGLDEEGNLNFDKIMAMTDFDLKYLVLDSVGNENAEIEYSLDHHQDLVTIEIDGIDFLVLDAQMVMNGMYHQPSFDYTAYIQYGRPPTNDSSQAQEDFQQIKGFGRIYIYADTQTKTSYFFYIIAPNMSTLIETEKNFILKTKITR